MSTVKFLSLLCFFQMAQLITSEFSDNAFKLISDSQYSANVLTQRNDKKYGLLGELSRNTALDLLSDDNSLISILEKMPENLDSWSNNRYLSYLNQALADRLETNPAVNCGCGNCGFGHVCVYYKDIGCMCNDGWCECCC